jgi:hypothetical protein
MPSTLNGNKLSPQEFWNLLHLRYARSPGDIPTQYYTPWLTAFLILTLALLLFVPLTFVSKACTSQPPRSAAIPALVMACFALITIK